MGDFLAALRDHAFLRQALLAGALIGVASGIVGSYVVTRRISYIAASISHFLLAGLGAARYAQVVLGWQWAHPLLGAAVAALMGAGIIGWIGLRGREREDTAIGALWAIGMAIGLLFISATPGYSGDLMNYLFGNILLASRTELVWVIILDAVILASVAVFYNQFQAVCFDEEFARLRGLNVEFYYILLLALTALTVVLLSVVVGIVMVIALLTIPAALAGRFSKRLWHMMAVAAGLSILFTSGGLAISYSPGLPVGAVSIALAGGCYLVVAVGAAVLRRGKA